MIAFAGEYDALPEVGHGCGHNLMCSSSAGAAIAAARVLGRDFAGEIRFIGTPAEEAGNGKVHLIARACSTTSTCASRSIRRTRTAPRSLALAVTEIGVTFHGKLAHASADPWLGKNALDALVLLYTMVAQWRQHLKPGERVHGIITHGGAAPNIVPDLTSGRWYLRTPVDEDLDAMIDRFRTMADAAADATGCTVELTIEPLNRCRTMVNSPTLLEIWRRHLAEAGSPTTRSTRMRAARTWPTSARGTDDPPVPGDRAARHARPLARVRRPCRWPRRRRMLPVAIRSSPRPASTCSATRTFVDRAWDELREGRAAGGAAAAERHPRRPGAMRRCWPRSTTSSTTRSTRTSSSIARGRAASRGGDRPRLRVRAPVRALSRRGHAGSSGSTARRRCWTARPPASLPTSP